MRSHQALFWVVFALVLAAVRVPAASAQTIPSVVSFSVGGQIQVLRYADPYAAQSATIQEAIGTIVPIYEKFWNVLSSGSGTTMDFRLFIDIGLPNASANSDLSKVAIQSVALPVPSTPWTGKTETTKTSVCAVQLYTDANLYATPERLQFELALDLAQCYLLHYASPPANPPDWWFKGLSYWMAVQVYPPPPDLLVKLQKDYHDNYNQNLLNAGEEALYYWEYLLGDNVPATLKSSLSTDLPTIVNGLKNLSGTVTFFTPDLFYAYAQTVEANALLWQPKSEDIAQDETVASFPDDVNLDLEDNSIVIETVSLPPLQPDEGIRIEADGLTVNGVLASISAEGQGSFPLSDGAAVQICGSPSSITVVAGRGSQAGIPDAALKFSKVESCKPEATPAVTEGAGLPACVVGLWNVRFTAFDQVAQITGLWQYTFNADGSLMGQMQNWTVTANGSSNTINFSYTGTLALKADAAVANRYNVTQMIQNLPTGTISGGSGSGSNPMTAQPAYLTCASSDAKNPTVTLYINSSGETLVWVLTRAS